MTTAGYPVDETEFAAAREAFALKAQTTTEIPYATLGGSLGPFEGPGRSYAYNQWSAQEPVGQEAQAVSCASACNVVGERQEYAHSCQKRGVQGL